MKEGMISEGVGGIQMSDVSVDTETGIVKMNRHVAVHDCGLVVNPKTAESQVYGACIMSICAALTEERIMDAETGRVLNADMEFYKLAGIGDIGEIIVHMDISPENDKRGIIGLGEPPAIRGIAAIANAVANAIGVRVAHGAHDARARLGGAREQEERLMQSFEYANPSTVKEAVALLGSDWSDAHVLAGGTDQISLMKDYRSHAQARGEHQEHQGAARHLEERSRTAHRRGGHLRRTRADAAVRAEYPSISTAVLGVTSPQIRNMGTVGGDLCQRPRCWYFRSGYGLLRHEGRQEPGSERRESLSRDFRRRTGLFRQRVQPRSGAGRAGRAR